MCLSGGGSVILKPTKRKISSQASSSERKRRTKERKNQRGILLSLFFRFVDFPFLLKIPHFPPLLSYSAVSIGSPYRF